ADATPPRDRGGSRPSITRRRLRSAASIATASRRQRRSGKLPGCSRRSSRHGAREAPAIGDQLRDGIPGRGAPGYAQELFRAMGGFSNFAISFSIISILTGAVTLYSHGLVMGGPAEMALGWPLVSLFTLTVALSMAELASSMPTSGAMYQWA